MKQMKVALPEELRARLDAASEKSGRSVAEEIRARVEASFTRDAVVDKPTRDLFEGLALLPAEVEFETGAAWHEHAGAHETLTQAIISRLEALKPKGSTAFGDRPHATVFDDDPYQLASRIELRLRRDPNFTGSPTRRLLEEEHQEAKLAKDLAKRAAARRRRGLPVSLINEPFDQPKKRGK
jgi:hypothetical protein